MNSGLSIGETPSAQQKRDTIKCPRCTGRKVIRKGFQKNKLGNVQIFYCKSCRKRFILRLLKNKTYDADIIRQAVNHHNLGNSLRKTAEFINGKFKLKIAKSTIHNWVKEFKGLDIQVIKERKDHDEIVSKQFKHRGISYNFKYHKIKLFGCRHTTLINYVARFKKGCPEFFRDIEKRCSTTKDILADAHVFRCKDPSSKAARLALSSSARNSDRHVCVENFMLLNDDSTMAVEVPVWLYEKNLGVSISGHIDILQARRDKIYVLDYKPGAAKLKQEGVVGQIYLYARGLSFRTGLPLSNFRCAWFDEEAYFEFDPSKARLRFQSPDGRVFEDRYSKKRSQMETPGPNSRNADA